MRQSFDSVLPETEPAHQGSRHPRAPAVERIAGWSARHRKTAVFGWLLMVAAVFAVSQLLGSKNLPNYDPGQAGQAGEPAIDAPKSLAVVQTANAIQRAFPQTPSPAQVVVTGTDVTGSRVQAAVAALQGRAATGGAIREPVTATTVGSGPARPLVVNVPLAGNGSNTASVSALQTLRTNILPTTLGRVPGVRFAVTGDTASNSTSPASCTPARRSSWASSPCWRS